MKRVIQYVLILGAVAYLLAVFVPRTYPVPPMQLRKGTQYWKLSTGSDIAYTFLPSQGTKKSYAVIYVQGGPGGFISERNIKLLEPLSEDGFDVYLYDQVGSGQSARLSDIKEYTAGRHKRDLEEIVEKTGAEKVILIGQSWGAILATMYIADHPGKVAKAVFVGPGGIFPLREELLDVKAPDSLDLHKPIFSNREANEKMYNIRTGAMAFFARNFSTRIASDKEADDFQTYLNSELNKATVCDTSKALKAEDGGGFYAQVMTVQSFSQIPDPRSKLKNSNIPLLILKGQCDNQPWGFTNEYLELFPNHQLKIIPGAGHSVSVEQPELYTKTIRDFLNNE